MRYTFRCQRRSARPSRWERAPAAQTPLVRALIAALPPQIGADNLPEDWDDVNEILASELAPLPLWHVVAVEYHKRGKFEAFKSILTKASSDEAIQAFQAQITERAHGSQAKTKALTGELNRGRMKLLVAQGAHETQRALDTKSEQTRKSHLSAATNFLNSAMKINQMDADTNVAKGLHQLASDGLNEKSLARASKIFDTALRIDKSNIPAMLGLACTRYYRKDYSAALRYYCAALKSYPGCPPEVRLGIGLCACKLKQYERATYAFERVLELQPDNVGAMAGLATILYNQKTLDAMPKCTEYLERAYSLQPNYAPVLNLLAQMSFNRGELDAARVLAERARDNAREREVKAESFYQLGRLVHETGDLQTAGLSYSRAVEFDPTHHPARFGYAQWLNKRGKTARAIKELQWVVREHPTNHDAIRILGSLYVKFEGTLKAGQRLLKRAAKLFPEDEGILVKLGESFERSNALVAKNYYLSAIEMYKKSGRQVPFQLLNNVGVILHSLATKKRAAAMKRRGPGGSVRGAAASQAAQAKIDALFNQAKLAFEQADSAARASKAGGEKNSSSKADTAIPPECVSIRFNIARLLETQGRPDSARAIYKKLTDQFPDYLDSWLRLGALAQATGQSEEAQELYEKAIELDAKNMDALSMLGSLHLEKNDLKSALDCFYKMKGIDKDDAYANLAIADINHTFANSITKDPQTRRQQFLAAHQVFKRVLQANPRNLYAANGLGISFRHIGRLEEAKEIFERVTLADESVAPAWVNLGHTYVELKQYANAANVYERCISSFPNLDRVELLTNLAAAQFMDGKTRECRRSLLRALHLDPANSELRFNMGLCLEESALKVLKLDIIQRSHQDVKNAYRQMREATSIFDALRLKLQDKSSAGGPLAAKNKALAARVKRHWSFCKQSEETAKNHLNHAEKLHRKQQQDIAVQRELAEAIRAKEEESKRRKKEEESRRLEEERRKRKERDEKLRQMRQEWAAANVKASAAVAKDATGGGEDEGGDDGKEMGLAAVETSEEAMRREQEELFGSVLSDDDEGDGNDGDEKAEAGAGDAAEPDSKDDDAEARGAGAKSAAVKRSQPSGEIADGRPAKKMRRVLDDDDEEEEME